MHETGSITVDLAGLSRFITDTKAYQDYSLNEYEMLRYFLEQTQPRTIQIVGGFTNLDLFYAGQNLAADCEVTNWDPCTDNIFSEQTEAEIRERQHQYREATGFRARYQWIPTLKRTEDLPPADLIWLQANCENTPPPHDHVIMTHYGRTALATQMAEISRHSPIRGIGRRTAVFSRTAVDISQGPYPTRGFRFLLWPCHEVMR